VFSQTTAKIFFACEDTNDGEKILFLTVLPFSLRVMIFSQPTDNQCFKFYKIQESNFFLTFFCFCRLKQGFLNVFLQDCKNYSPHDLANPAAKLKYENMRTEI
jgi:hypothetical protein